MLNKSNMKPLELFVDVEKPPLLERKSSEEGSSILQISSKTEDTKDPKDHAKYDLDKAEKKDSSLNKPKKNIFPSLFTVFEAVNSQNRKQRGPPL